MARPKGVGLIKIASPPPTRTRLVGLRLRQDDADRLEDLARGANVGLSTFARLILEEYVRVHAKKE